MEIKISKMTLSDLNDIDFGNNNLLSSFNFPNYECIVAKIENEITGFAILWFSVDDVHIIDIFVKEIYRNKGIGSSLLQELINISKNYNYSEITLEVNVHNLPAQKLYNKFHFERVGIRKKYYNNTDDAIIMTLHI